MITSFRRSYFFGRPKYRAKVKILSIGNLHSGGTGKTPLVLECADHLRRLNPVILSRGYRGLLSSCGGRVSLSSENGADHFGDEPWMMANRGQSPVYVGADRVRLVKWIEQDLPTSRLVILDDGFQHLRIARDVDIIVLRAEEKIENSFCLPLGDLREPLSAIQFAHAVVIVHGEADREGDSWVQWLKRLYPSVPYFFARRKGVKLHGTKGIPPEGERLLGFCGIAGPHRFEDQLKSIPGAAFLRGFPDHHSYSTQDIDALCQAAASAGAHLVTTEKDYFKLEKVFLSRNQSLFALRIGYEISEEFWYLLKELLE